jgi:hypothetical protein
MARVRMNEVVELPKRGEHVGVSNDRHCDQRGEQPTQHITPCPPFRVSTVTSYLLNALCIATAIHNVIYEPRTSQTDESPSP